MNNEISNTQKNYKPVSGDFFSRCEQITNRDRASTPVSRIICPPVIIQHQQRGSRLVI